MYYGNFVNKSDICNEFGISDFDGVVIFAAYDTPAYEGYANVVFVHMGKFYHVYGSHCSCYGLAEGGWEPEEMPVEALRRFNMQDYHDEFLKCLDTVESTVSLDGNPEHIELALRLAFG